MARESIRKFMFKFHLRVIRADRTVISVICENLIRVGF